MDDQPIARILSGLRSPSAHAAWTEFLEQYTPLILQVVRAFEREADAVADCYLYVCEQLSRNRFQRLRKFRPEGPATFATWLRAVVRNLCLDWHRQEFGRRRVFQSVGRLSGLDQEIFRAVYEQGFSAEEAFERLRSRHGGLTALHVHESCARIEERLTARQRWLLSVRSEKTSRIEDRPGDDPASLQIADGAPDPETQAGAREREAALARAIEGLPAGDRLLLRLRYEKDMTLEQIARLRGYKDAQGADRKIREVLETLKKLLG